MPWIVLVSHVGPIKALLAASLDLPLDRGGRRIFLDPGTVSVVDWGDPPILRLCNSHAHAGWTSARWMEPRRPGARRRSSRSSRVAELGADRPRHVDGALDARVARVAGAVVLDLQVAAHVEDLDVAGAVVEDGHVPGDGLISMSPEPSSMMVTAPARSDRDVAGVSSIRTAAAPSTTMSPD